MILEAAVINITRNLDILNQKEAESPCSHEKLKDEALSCLLSLIENAPIQEFVRLTDADDYDILIGYLINVLCQISKCDKSRNNRTKSLNVILALVDRLDNIHDSIIVSKVCSTKPLKYALPGLSSALFKLIISDTKLPKELIVSAIKVLNKFICIALSNCHHNSCPLTGQDLANTCENIAIRFNFLIDYITTNASYIGKEVKFEVLNLCQIIACKTKLEMVKCSLHTIIKYMAFIASSGQPLKELKHEAELKIMIVVDSIRGSIMQDADQIDGLDELIIKNSMKIMNDLDENYSSMLLDERESKLSILYGYLRLLPDETMTTFFEFEQTRIRFLDVLVKLTEFTTQQPFLFLTDIHIGDQALEGRGKIYTFEKQFKYISKLELTIITNCAELFGEIIELNFIGDLLRNELGRYSSASNLYVTHLIMGGILRRSRGDKSKLLRLSENLMFSYIDQTDELHQNVNELLSLDQVVSVSEILKIVIAIETLTTLVEIQLKYSDTNHAKEAILRPLICPLLNWASSQSRAISEAALSSLSFIAHLYNKDCIKSLIEDNIDYIVDGVSRMLSNFPQNSEVTNVLALAFKLSSKDSFFYFKDVYERIFNLLATYHLTRHSTSITMLFYRTLSILDQWEKASGGGCTDCDTVSLKTAASIKDVVHSLDIRRRIVKLQNDVEEANRIRREIYDLETNEPDLSQDIAEEIKSGNNLPFAQREDNKEEEEDDESKEQRDTKKVKPPEIELTEKILTLCISLISSNFTETKILALKTASCGFRVLAGDEDTLLPLVHQLWSPLLSRLNSDYRLNLEINMSAFECLVTMAACAKDFIKSRTLESVVPRLCLFLESQANQSLDKNDYGPYCMSVAFKCQLMIMKSLGALTYNIQLAYKNLWRIIEVCLLYLNPRQVESLRAAARDSLHYLMALDADCVWYLAKQRKLHRNLPFELIYSSGWM